MGMVICRNTNEKILTLLRASTGMVIGRNTCEKNNDITVGWRSAATRTKNFVTVLRVITGMMMGRNTNEKISDPTSDEYREVNRRIDCRRCSRGCNRCEKNDICAMVICPNTNKNYVSYCK